MARNEENDFIVVHSQTQSYPNGSSSTQSRDVRGTRYLRRPDIVRTVPDASGFRSPTEYYARKVYQTPVVGTITYTATGSYKWKHITDTHPCTLAGCGFPLPGVPNSLENELKVKCLRKVRESHVNLAMTLAFAGQTLNMLWTRLLNVAEVLDAVRDRDWKKVYRLLRVPGYKPGKRGADYTLEVQFGWRQLIADIVGIAQHLESGLRNEHMYVYGKAGAKSASPVYHVRKNIYTWGNVGDAVVNGTNEEFHSMVLIFKVQSPVRALLSQLGLTNPAVLAWDVIPWSFVVNWVIPIGDWLESLDATVGLSYVGGTYSRGNRCEGGTISVTPSNVAGMDGSGIGEGEFSYFFYERSVIDPYVSPFYVKNPFRGGIVRAITATALVAQKASGMRNDFSDTPLF